MLTVTKEFKTETAHRLTNYNGRCAHLHGHSYRWVISVASAVLDNGMVFDFKDLKKIMTRVLDPLDHCLVLAPDDPLLSWDIPVDQLFQATNGKKPRLKIWHENPTAESFADWAFDAIEEQLHSGVYVTSVTVWETATSYARSDLYE